MQPVNWFEIPVSDLARAQAFYERVFGVELAPNEMGGLKMAWFPMAPGSAGASGALVKGEGYTPSYAGTMVYFTVESIEAALMRVIAGGGRMITPRMSIGVYGFVAHFEDCEGNRVALHAMQ